MTAKVTQDSPPPNTPEEVCNNPKFYEIFGDAALTPAERVMKSVLLSEGEKQFLKDLELDAEKFFYKVFKPIIMATEQKKTHWKKLHNPDYLGAYSLMEGEKPIEIVVQIKSVAVQEVVGPDGKKEEHMVAQIVGNKPLIINATNAKAITKAYGSPYVEDWAGKKVTLFVARVKAFGDVVDALRIRDKAPTGTPEAKLPDLNPSHEKWADARKAILAGNTTVEKIRKSYTLSVESELLLTSPEE